MQTNIIVEIIIATPSIHPDYIPFDINPTITNIRADENNIL